VLNAANEVAGPGRFSTAGSPFTHIRNTVERVMAKSNFGLADSLDSVAATGERSGDRELTGGLI